MPEPLPDDAYVVRGGVMESSTLRTNVEVHNLEFPGEWAISVWSEVDLEPDEIARRAHLPHGQIRVALVGPIRELGHDVVRSDEPPHADLTFASEPTEDDFEALRAVFGPPEPNPGVGQEVT